MVEANGNIKDEEMKSSAAASAAAAANYDEEEKKDGDEKIVHEAKENEDLSQLFVKLDDGVPSDVIESLCMECKENGETRFMYTKIPMFKEIIISSFACEHCGYKNTEVQFGGKLEDTGTKYVLNVADESCLNRSIVKSEFATIRIPEIQFEIPPQTQKGSIKTVEGFLLSTIEGIGELQEQRRIYDPDTAAQIDAFLDKLRDMREGRNLPWTFEIEDPSGNSFVQNPNAPEKDEYCTFSKFFRTVEMYQEMGYNADEAANKIQQDKMIEDAKKAEEQQPAGTSTKAITQTKEEQDLLLQKMQAFAKREADPEITANYMDFSKPIDDEENEANKGDVTKEVMQFPQACYACTAPGVCKMCIATIPFFKEIIIMAFSCETCGHKSTEIKQGGGISDHATKITFAVQKAEDLNRDVFKSDTCVVSIPEIEFEMTAGTLGSMYSTVEGVLDQTIRHLNESNPFGKGDSAEGKQFLEFMAKLEELKSGAKPFTMILDDPLSNCFIYNPNAPQDDPQIQVEVYDRTQEQEDDLGISDMRV